MTKQAENARNYILTTLADGQFHSGEALGSALGVSRAAVSKHIKVLTSLGLDIFSVTGRGYKLAEPITLLDENLICENSRYLDKEALSVLNVIDSTNQFVRTRLHELQSGHVCLAEAQTAGRGRHGRTWVSPYGASLYVSMYWQFAGGHQALSGLSLAVGVAIARTLQSFNVEDVRLKWPNDVYAMGRKLAGVLIEVEGQMGSECDCVLGIGLNVNLPDTVNGIDQPFIDLKNATSELPDRNLLAARLIDDLYEVLEVFSRDGLVPFLVEWQDLDIFRGEPVRLLMGEREVQGICSGINDSGALLLDMGGKLEAFYGGEISVRSI